MWEDFSFSLNLFCDHISFEGFSRPVFPETLTNLVASALL